MAFVACSRKLELAGARTFRWVPSHFAKISTSVGSEASRARILCTTFPDLSQDNIMPGVTKRKLRDDATTATGASKKVRPSDAPAKKVQKKPAPPPESESSDDDRDPTDDEEEREVEGDNTPNDEAEPSTSASADEPKKSFRDLGIREELCDTVESLNYKNPTPIQEQAIPLALEGRDVIGLAETGSGKTAAFVLPILQSLLEKPQPLFGLILAPTRELAYQIAQQVDALGSIINVKCATLVGGMDMVPQAIALSKRPHIVVATPGRLLDHLENTKGFSLKQ